MKCKQDHGNAIMNPIISNNDVSIYYCHCCGMLALDYHFKKGDDSVHWLSHNMLMEKVLDKYDDENNKNKTREGLAELCHEQWSDWMKYFINKCACMPDGGRNVSAAYVTNLLKQIDTKYKDLSEEEKNSDREESDKFIKYFRSIKIVRY